MAPRYTLSESESEPESELSSAPAPSEDGLEKALRDVVARIYKAGKMEELTLKRVRLAAEKDLDLEEGFYKGGDWKAKSDQIIKDEVERLDNAPEESSDEDEKQTPSPPPKPKPAKRTKPSPSASRKRRKISTPEPEDEDQGSASPDDQSEEEVKKPTKKQPKSQKKSQPTPVKEQVSDESDNAEEDDKSPEEPKADPKDDSESEMSVVLDEESPKPKARGKRQTSAESPPQKGKKKAAPKASSKAKEADQDPDQAEIKRLQGWLVKCGIRKMWWRELQPYETPKAKIKHLKDMLKEVGMEGRYSQEKASQIKEQRELQADLETVQEGDKMWGKGAEDEDNEDGRPRRRLNRGRQSLAFLESEGEETD